MSTRFDHLAICCERLADGVAAVEAALGVPLESGGEHPDFGTHNRLLALGPDAYLEVIAIDPSAPPPEHPRWFDLDRFSGPPRLTNWVVRVRDLPAACAAAPPGIGAIRALSRGPYHWRMAVPEDGRLPFGGLHPALIAWDGPHPADALPNAGCFLSRLEISAPEPDMLRTLPGLEDSRIALSRGLPGLTAWIETPGGLRRL